MISSTQLFKCLSDETRLLATLLIFKEGELCVCELTDALNVSQPKISRHLARLRECGLLLGERRGQWVYYRISTNLDNWMQQSLSLALEGNKEMLTEYQQRLNQSLCK